MKKIIIVGAGISGLTAGIYGLKNGFEVEIYELHNIAGGECTGWDRGKYHFDGCIHWLMGSKKGTALNKIWQEVGALDDSIEIIHHEQVGQWELDGETITLSRNVDRLERDLLRISPSDKTEIVKMCDAIRAFGTFEMPTDKPFDMMKLGDTVKMILKMLPYGRYMKYNKIDINQLAAKFQHPLIKEALTGFMSGEYSALALLSTLGSMASGDSGWPVGGSRKFAQRMEKKLRDLGGKLFFKARVEKILIENDSAKGILLSDGRKISGDYVISATDGHEALFDLLDGQYLSDIHRQMFTVNEDIQVHSSFQVWLGIATDLSKEPESIRLELPQPVRIGGKSFDKLWLLNYAFDKTLAPEGHSVLSSFFFAENFEWWEALYQDKVAYKKEKERIAAVVKENVERAYPATCGKIEQVDVATPMTYVRYCNAWRGAWMSWVSSPKLKTRSLPMKLEGLSNYVMAGQWIMPPGGLPVAVVTGKWAIQHVCAAEKKSFITE